MIERAGPCVGIAAAALLAAGCASGPEGPGFASGSSAFHPIGHTPEQLAACDFNGDGRDDFVVAGRTSQGQGRTTVLVTGAGRFTEELTLERGFPVLATADFDADGNCDFAGLTGGEGGGMRGDVRIFYGTGGGRFPQTTSRAAPPAYPRTLARGDLTGDGVDDLVVFYKTFRNRSDLMVFPGGPDRNRPGHPQGHRAGGPVAAALLADLDGDGDRDVAVLRRNRRVAVLANRMGRLEETGKVAFGEPADGPELRARMVTGDFDGDGNADLAVSDRDVHRVFVISGDERPELAATYRFPRRFPPTDLAAADLDGDGAEDLLVLRQAEEEPARLTALRMLTEDGGLTFRNTGNRFLEDLTRARHIRMADVDEAGPRDAVVWGRSDGESYILTVRDLRIEVPGR